MVEEGTEQDVETDIFFSEGWGHHCIVPVC